MSTTLLNVASGAGVSSFYGGDEVCVPPGTICYQIDAPRSFVGSPPENQTGMAVLTGPEAVAVSIAILKDALERPGVFGVKNLCQLTPDLLALRTLVRSANPLGHLRV